MASRSRRPLEAWARMQITYCVVDAEWGGGDAQMVYWADNLLRLEKIEPQVDPDGIF